MNILACMGCHLHWLAILLLPVALWVMKIFRRKGKNCPCDCHKDYDEKYSCFSPETQKSIRETQVKGEELIELLNKGNID